MIGGSMSGFKELERRLQTLAKEDATKAGQSANRAGAVVLKKRIEAEAPVSDVAEGATITRHNKDGSTRSETHHKIKNSIRIKKVRAEEGRVENAVGTGQAYHSVFEEFGSIHNAPNPFMSRALEGGKDDMMAAIAKALNKQLIRRGG